MNELVKRLSEGLHEVQANRPDKSGSALKERIELKYVHILFKSTGTEIGIRLDMERCNLSDVDFEQNTGVAHLEGVLTLNYDKVRCLADIDISTMEGSGKLLLEDEVAYKRIISA